MVVIDRGEVVGGGGRTEEEVDHLDHDFLECLLCLWLEWEVEIFENEMGTRMDHLRSVRDLDDSSGGLDCLSVSKAE